MKNISHELVDALRSKKTFNRLVYSHIPFRLFLFNYLHFISKTEYYNYCL